MEGRARVPQLRAQLPGRGHHVGEPPSLDPRGTPSHSAPSLEQFVSAVLDVAGPLRHRLSGKKLSPAPGGRPLWYGPCPVCVGVLPLAHHSDTARLSRFRFVGISRFDSAQECVLGSALFTVRAPSLRLDLRLVLYFRADSCHVLPPREEACHRSGDDGSGSRKKTRARVMGSCLFRLLFAP